MTRKGVSGNDCSQEVRSVSRKACVVKALLCCTDSRTSSFFVYIFGIDYLQFDCPALIFQGHAEKIGVRDRYFHVETMNNLV